MGLRVGIIVCVTSFLLGVLFVHWIADSLTLWKSSVTNENAWTAAAYYALFARVPREMGYVLALIVSGGSATILWSFANLGAENLMFDGASIFLLGTAVATYLYKVVPIYDSVFSSVPTYAEAIAAKIEISPALKSEVLNLATSNLICSVSLTGVLALQAARWWAERSDDETVSLATAAATSVPGSGYVSGAEGPTMGAETRMKASSGRTVMHYAKEQERPRSRFDKD